MADNVSIPASVIMNINYTMCTCTQAGLHQLIILAKVGGVKGAAKVVVDKILPRHRESEDVEFVN